MATPIMNKVLCLLAVTGTFIAAPANAATLDGTQAQTFAKDVVTYLNANSSTIGLTAADLATINQLYTAISSTSVGLLNQITSVSNGTLQSSPNCSGVGGSFTTSAAFSINTACIQDMVKSLQATFPNGVITNGLSVDAAVAGVAYAVYAGAPLTIPGTNITPTASNPTPTTPVTVTPQTVAEKIAAIIVPQIQRATSIQQASIISNVVSNIFSARAPNAPGAPVRVSLNGEQGMASGNQIGSLNAWVNAAETKIGNQALASMFSGKVTNAIGGIDYTVSQEMVAGVSLGHDRVSLDFNFGGLTNSGLVSTGWMIAPYVGYQINETLSADVALGYASGDVDTRTSGAIVSETYSRNFLALNLTSTHWMDDIQLLAKASYIAANEKVASTNKMEQLRLGGQVGYWMDGIMPYATVTYVRDLKISTGGIQPVGPDKDGWTVAIGANLFSKGAMYGGVSLSKEYGRNDSSNQVFMANIGYRF